MGMAGHTPIKKVGSIAVESDITYTADFHNIIQSFTGYSAAKAYLYIITGNESTSQYRGVCSLYYCNPNGTLSNAGLYVRYANSTHINNTVYEFRITANSTIDIYEVVE